jgi:hypothetical protein
MQTGATIALFFVLGWAAGAAHFALLRRNVNLLVAGSSALGAVALTLGRFALTAAIFTLVAIFYGPAALWTLAGFVGARVAMVKARA